MTEEKGEDNGEVEEMDGSETVELSEPPDGVISGGSGGGGS